MLVSSITEILCRHLCTACSYALRIDLYDSKGLCYRCCVHYHLIIMAVIKKYICPNYPNIFGTLWNVIYFSNCNNIFLKIIPFIIQIRNSSLVFTYYFIDYIFATLKIRSGIRKWWLIGNEAISNLWSLLCKFSIVV